MCLHCFLTATQFCKLTSIELPGDSVLLDLEQKSLVTRWRRWKVLRKEDKEGAPKCYLTIFWIKLYLQCGLKLDRKCEVRERASKPKNRSSGLFEVLRIWSENGQTKSPQESIQLSPRDFKVGKSHVLRIFGKMIFGDTSARKNKSSGFECEGEMFKRTNL